MRIMGNDNLTQEQLTAIIDLAQLEDARVTTTYSGRGMYGNRCVGITYDDDRELSRFTTALAVVMAGLHEDDGQIWLDDIIEAVTKLPSSSRDNMGYSTITYWSGITCPEWVDEDEEDDNR